MKRAFFKHIIEVSLSNFTTIISGIIVGFITPKFLSVEGYGFYKTFTLYVTYIGFFSLGLVDGIVLNYGGKNYDQLERGVFRAYFKWYTCINLFFSMILFILGIIFTYKSDIDTGFIMIMFSINLIAVNFTGYFQQISQITMRFREYSLRRILQSVCNIVAVLVLLVIYNKNNYVDYKLYIVFIVSINVVLTGWYLFTYRDIVKGGSISMRHIAIDVKKLIIIGLPLMVANLCSTLILTLDRQFVNLLFDTKTYAIYAFAYSMLALVTVAISAISTVLYPILKRSDEVTLIDIYGKLISAILIIVFAGIMSYFPLCIFIKWFLPKYIDSLIIFRVIFPGMAISSAITIIMNNYYKTFGKAFIFFKKGVYILVFSVIANGVAFIVFKSTISISVASIITMLIWYLYVENMFVKEMGYSRWKNLIYMLIMILGFYLISKIQNDFLALVIYLIFFGTITFFFFKSIILDFMNKKKNKVDKSNVHIT